MIDSTFKDVLQVGMRGKYLLLGGRCNYSHFGEEHGTQIHQGPAVSICYQEY